MVASLSPLLLWINCLWPWWAVRGDETPMVHRNKLYSDHCVQSYAYEDITQGK